MGSRRTGQKRRMGKERTLEKCKVECNSCIKYREDSRKRRRREGEETKFDTRSILDAPRRKIIGGGVRWHLKWKFEKRKRDRNGLEEL